MKEWQISKCLFPTSSTEFVGSAHFPQLFFVRLLEKKRKITISPLNKRNRQHKKVINYIKLYFHPISSSSSMTKKKGNNEEKVVRWTQQRFGNKKVGEPEIINYTFLHFHFDLFQRLSNLCTWFRDDHNPFNSIGHSLIKIVSDKFWRQRLIHWTIKSSKIIT